MKRILIIALAVLTTALASCSQNTKEVSYYKYRGYDVESHTIRPVYIEAVYQDVYLVGDTVLVSLNGRLTLGRSAPKVVLQEYQIELVKILEVQD